MPRSNSLSRVGPCANSSTKLPPTRLMAAIFPGSRRTPRVGISGPSTARRRSAFTGKVRTSPWPGAPGFQRRSIPPIEAGTTSPRPVPHSASVSCARATSSWRDTPKPRASFIASAVLRAAAALTPNPWDTGSGVSKDLDFHGAGTDHFFDDAPGHLGRPMSLVHEDINRRPRGVSRPRDRLDSKAQREAGAAGTLYSWVRILNDLKEGRDMSRAKSLTLGHHAGLPAKSA